ncbi:Bifunctional glutamate/proline--tRNA ligase [Galdieria sulphuraria]|nr:Bifunctional glutamate/proline--tRNA ligase [Galdieria sulphuraria]
MDREAGESSEIELTTLRISQGTISSSPPASSPLSIGEPMAASNLPQKKKNGSTREGPVPSPKAKNASNLKKKESREGLEVRKSEDFSMWYNQLVQKAELIEFYDISGCYILRPASYRIWESIQSYFDKEIKKLGVENAYFPIFVSASRLNQEKDHVAGFAPEVAWVTKSGDSPLEEPIAVRPTSETVMYPSFAKWIRSHRDLPLKINQWNNVVRWEFKHPTPFLRSREFLWQEGHTAFSTKEEADCEVLQILELYRSVYEDLLAVPVIKGLKSEKEKFAGGLYTTTVEAFIPHNGRAIQAATSHCLGQNFANMFDITFEDENRARKKVYQNSWGLTTRSIGVMIMVHSDDKGLVLPPNVAPIQVVVVPIRIRVNQDEINYLLEQECGTYASQLETRGIRVKLDSRNDKTPGWKFHHWELRGVCLRVEVGVKEMHSNEVVIVRRDTGERTVVLKNDLCERITQLLSTMQEEMLLRARNIRDHCISIAYNWNDFMTAIDSKKMVLAPWCTDTRCEEEVKRQSMEFAASRGNDSVEEQTNLTGAVKTLCLPFEEELNRLDISPLSAESLCFLCHASAKAWTLWGRSY